MPLKDPEARRAYIKKWEAENPEKVRGYRRKRVAEKAAYGHEYRVAHKQQRAAYAARYREANRDAVLKEKRLWYQENAERLRAKARAWRAENPDYNADYSRRHYAENPGRVDVNTARRRARKLGAFIEDVDRLVVLERDDGVCGICDDDVDPLDFHVDHIVALANGGEHSYTNVQVAHPLCNRQKGVKSQGGSTDLELRADEQHTTLARACLEATK